MRSIFLSIIITITGLGTSAQTLEDYFKLAAENNPGLQAKYKEVEIALQKVSQVNALPDPTLTVSAFGQMIETRVGPQRARFSLSQMFPWFGTLHIQGDAMTLMAEAKYQGFIDERNKLYYQIAVSYYPLVEISQHQKIEQANINILESYKRIATSKFEHGNGAMVDVLRADIMLKQAKTNLVILDERKRTLKIVFNKLLNRDNAEDILVTDSLTVDNLLNDFVQDSILADHPLLHELDLKIKGSEAMEQVARKQGFPKLGIGIDYIIVGKRTDLGAGMVPPSDNGKDAIMPMVSVTLPIFRSKYKAARKEAQLMQESYTFQKQEAINSLISGFEMASYEMRNQRELLSLYHAQALETQQALNLLYKAYSNSERNFDEVLQTQQQLLMYQKMEATAITQYYMTTARLDYLTAKTF